MTIFAFIFWVVIALFVSGVITNHKDIKNKVHFYVARDEDGELWLYLGKPIREKGKNFFKCKVGGGDIICTTKRFKEFGLNINNYKDLKWEDEPVEVFLNLEDLV